MYVPHIHVYNYIYIYTCRYSQTSEDISVTAVQIFLQATTLSDVSLKVSYMYNVVLVN